MDRLKIGKITKKIICIVVVLMLCNFIIPNYTFAVETEGGGTLLGTIAELFCIIPDAVINLLQTQFLGSDIYVVTYRGQTYLNEGYKILYSPVTIFAGEVPAFSIDFINPKKYYKTIENITYGGYQFSDSKTPIKIDDTTSNEDIAKDCEIIGKWASCLSEIYNNVTSKEECKISDKNIWHDWARDFTFCDLVCMYHMGEKLPENLPEERMNEIKKTDFKTVVNETIDQMYKISYKLCNENGSTAENDLSTIINYFNDQALLNTASGDKIVIKSYEKVEGTSSAKILQTTIATWYNALRRIALVGLLSVLLYIGIRIVMTSTSAKDKAKYKKMLKDWLIALCMLFVLHYVMSVIIIVVENINEVISASVIGEDGEDALMTTIRNEIGGADNWGNAIAYVAIYCTLTVYTIIFTIQYIRRVIYLAFLTMIAPLITLTYPLDKIKDNKAQAFDMWLKDYIFFSLIQVLHLLIYYIFVSSAIELSNKGNWLYAIVAVGFITKAEKIMKKMFGFEKSKSMGALAAGATGALVSNLMNKGPHGGGVKHPGGNAGSSGSASTKAVRTQTTFPLQQMSFGGSMGVQQQSMAQQGIPQQGTSQQGTAQQSTPQQGTARQSTPQQGTARQSTSQPSTARQNTSQQSSPQQSSSQQSTAGQSSPQQGTARQSTLQQSTARQSTSQPNTAQQNPAQQVTSQQVTSQQGTAQQNSVQVPYTKPQRNIKGGVWALTKKYHRKVGGTIVGIGTGATGAMLGFAAGVSQGDLGVALGGAVAGGKSGYNLGDRAYNGVFDTAGNIIKEKDNIWDTAREGAYGEEYANNVKFDREFRRSNDYKELRKKYADSSKPHTMQILDADVQQMLDAGISDSKQMDKILKNNRKHPRKYSMDNAIKYSQMAENCKDKVLYDKKSFIRFCRDNDVNDLSDENLEKIRKCIIEFK